MGGGKSTKGEKAPGSPNEANQSMGQSQSPQGNSMDSPKGRWSCSPKIKPKFPTPPTISKEDRGAYLNGQQSKEIMVMEGSMVRRLGNPLEIRPTFDNTDKEREDCRREQKGPKELEEVIGLEIEDDSSTCVVETDELLGVDQVVNTGLEDIASGSVSNS